ncbi:MAG: glycosyltransferase N-terminal domain-containing protein [Deltaproteobacteria bacterium]|nr:glycosyltransferase N-terminal domain-containing protein [Deltaproteobacteria bacterium]
MGEAVAQLADAPRIPPTGAERCYAAIAPVIFTAVHLAARLRGATPAELRQRRGFLPAAGPAPLWLHGASAGEMAAAHGLVALLRAGGHAVAAAYTTTNAAGRQWIESRLAPGDVAALAPWDAPRWVARACDAWRPRALILIETELWPALIGAANARQVPVISASARFYPGDAARYRRAGVWMRPTFQRLSAVLAQDAAQAAEFVALGVPAARCVVAGNLKHAASSDTPPRAAARARFGAAREDRLVAFGSLHADEVPLIAPGVDRLAAAGARCLVAPRHRDGVAALERLAAARGWRLVRRSSAHPAADWSVLLLDRVGELRAAYAAADLAVVGGSFTPHGGHDLVEAVRAGVPVLFGPHTEHVAASAAALAAATPKARLPDAAGLVDALVGWMADPSACAALLERQRAALPDAAAIASLYRAALAPLL